MSVIDHSTSTDILYPKGFGTGLTPRDWALYPQEMFDPPRDMKLIPRSEWSARCREQDELKSSLWHIRQTAANGQQMPTLDQNGQGYCWAYSTTRCVMYLRAVSNQPYIRLSAHAIGCKVKDFRDEGGWCGLSAKFHREQGCPSADLWPEKSMSRSNDRPEVWANALGHKVTEEWVDLTRQVHDQSLTEEQIATCLLSSIPCALDFNWWGHSVCGIQWVEVEPGSFGVRIDNSWTDQWEEMGSSVLRGEKAHADGAVALRVTGGAVA